VIVLARGWHRPGRLELDSLVDEQGDVATVVDHHVGPEAVGELE
jgi:hypothetical protein